MLSSPRPISRKLYAIRPQKLKLLIRNHTTTFRWYNCRWPWRYFKVIRLFHIKFLVNGAWYGKNYYRLLIGNQFKSYTTFPLVPLLMTLNDIWRSFQSSLSFPRPVSQKLHKIRPQLLKLLIRNHTRAFIAFQQSLADFRVARSLCNSWASYRNNYRAAVSDSF